MIITKRLWTTPLTLWKLVKLHMSISHESAHWNIFKVWWVLLFWTQRVLLLRSQPPERYLPKTAGKTAYVMCVSTLDCHFFSASLPLLWEWTISHQYCFFFLQMDSEGFIPLGLIASFYRVQALTQDINLIVEVCIPLQMLLLL